MIWQNGYWQTPDSKISPFGTLAFQYGFGLFETILVRDGHPADLEQHIHRLQRSINQLDSESRCLFDTRSLKETVLLSLSERQEKTEVLKIIVYREAKQWNYLLMTRQYPYSKKDYERGFTLRQSESLRNPQSLLVYHKTLNYLENYLERLIARQAGYDDAYFLNSAGIVTECTTANLFIVLAEKLITSPIQAGLLPGIMRAKLLDKATALELTASETPISKEMLLTADAAIVTNALYGAMPISKIDDTNYPVDLTFIKRVNVTLDR